MDFQDTEIFSRAYLICTVALNIILTARLWRLRYLIIRHVSAWKISSTKSSALLLFVLVSSSLAAVSTPDVEQHTQYHLSLLVSLLSAFGLSLIISWEQQVSNITSVFVILYLLTAIINDSLHVYTLLATVGHTEIVWYLAYRLCVHSALLIFRRYSSQTSALFNSVAQPVKMLHARLSRVFFLWIYPILLHGYQNSVTDEDLPPLAYVLNPRNTRSSIIKIWSQRSTPETKATLPYALVRCIQKPLLSAIVPRLFLVGFRYLQPNLISLSVKFVQSSHGEPMTDINGLWLLFLTVWIYIGLAVSTTIYQQYIIQLKLMTRSALEGLIHEKAMTLPSMHYDDGKVITLISSDLDGLDGAAEMLHETWAQVIEVLVGVCLLANQVGWIWPVPLFLIYLCSHVSGFAVKHLQPRQLAWNEKTQTRLASTSSALGSFKPLKMLGLEQIISRKIQRLRIDELYSASRLRWIMVYYNASANALGIFSPTITLGIFAILRGSHGFNLDAETSFASLTILTMITHPANMVVTIVPRAVAALSGFERIQNFLLQDPLQDDRSIFPGNAREKTLEASPSVHTTQSVPAIQVDQVRLGHKEAVLENISLEIAAGSLTMVSGALGSGKTTLLRAILGEITPTDGAINLSTKRIAYCAQNPWLPSCTIKELIHGFSHVPPANQGLEEWYRRVTDACCLTYDLDKFPEGDQTRCGSRGVNLSGGQRQRIALARAVFAKCDVLLLDDPFSGLDGATEQAIFENLFGATGIARMFKTTVVLVSNSSQYFGAADQIVVLGNRKVQYQGTWANIAIKSVPIAKLFAAGDVRNLDKESGTSETLDFQLRVEGRSALESVKPYKNIYLYYDYLKTADKESVILFVLSTAFYAFFITIPQYWLQLWTNSSNGNIGFYLGGLFCLSAISWLSTSVQMWSVIIRLSPEAGLYLHNRLIKTVMSTSFSYISGTEIGSVLNRFSHDIQVVDKQLPSAIQTTLTHSEIFKLIMQILLICAADKWLTLTLPIYALLVYLMQRVYLRTTQQVRSLMSNSRAGVVANILESIEGLETIRSFQWTKTAIQGNIQSVAAAQRPELLLLCLQCWLKFALDILSATMGIVIMGLAVMGHQFTGAQLGAALNLLLAANSTLLKLIESWTTLETAFDSISRLKTLEETIPLENETVTDLKLEESWPCRGRIDIKSITVSYHSMQTEPSLQDLSLQITAGQKLFVYGRTGSGKSTLILALLRLLDLQSGRIELDGVDIKTVPLSLLRQRCFVSMSQDPLLLYNESLRFNLDPENSASDDDIIRSLQKVSLFTHFFGNDSLPSKETSSGATVAETRQRSILDREISLLSKLSVGQSQLLALCRVLLKANSLKSFGVRPVIILDEATSNLDSETESAIIAIIDDEFTQNGYTVIIIAHRLSLMQKYTKIGRDSMVWLADGRLKYHFRDLSPANLKHVTQGYDE